MKIVVQYFLTCKSNLQYFSLNLGKIVFCTADSVFHGFYNVIVLFRSSSTALPAKNKNKYICDPDLGTRQR